MRRVPPWLTRVRLKLDVDRPRSSMNSRAAWIVVMSVATSGCTRERSITHGADGAPEWDRRLAAAVAPGMTVDSARAMMQRNGFRCTVSAVDLWCDKESGGQFAIVRRRWQATLGIQDGHVRTVKGSTGLTGP
jgi:hypothetical protein